MAGAHARWGYLTAAPNVLLLLLLVLVTCASADAADHGGATVAPAAHQAALVQPRGRPAAIAADASSFVLMVNCGGPAGPGFVADKNFTDPSASIARAFRPDDGAAPNPFNDTVRYKKGGDGVLTFQVRLPADREYSVVFVFNEVYHRAAGQRVVHAELWAADTLLSRTYALDVFAIMGKRFAPMQQAAAARLPSPMLTIRIVGDVGDPAIAGFAIIAMDGGDVLGGGDGGGTDADMGGGDGVGDGDADDEDDKDNDDDDDDGDYDDAGSGTYPLRMTKGHAWGDGWFMAMTAGGLDMADGPMSGSRNFQDKTPSMPPLNAERMPASMPATYAAMNWTAKVKAAALVAPAGEPLEWMIRVPLAGAYEVILAWHVAAGTAAGTTVMDVEVLSDAGPAPMRITLDVAAATGGSGRLAVAHLPPRSPLLATDNLHVDAVLRVILRPRVGRAFLNALVVRQTPVGDVLRPSTRAPSGMVAPGRPDAPDEGPMVTVGPNGPTEEGDDGSSDGSVPPPMTAKPTVVINMGGRPADSGYNADRSVMTVADTDFFGAAVAGPDGSPPRGGVFGYVYRASPAAAAAANLSADPVASSVRYGGRLEYTVAVPAAGVYDLAVVSVELVWGTGVRVFDVDVAVDGGDGGTTRLATGVDLAASPGKYRRATWEMRNVTVEAAFTVVARAQLDKACIAAIILRPVRVVEVARPE